MKRNVKLMGLLLGAFVLTTNVSEAQIGLGGLKDKVKKNTKVAVTPYDKAMKEGDKNEQDGNLVEAYKSYEKALELKSGDYSAKSALGRVTSSLEESYFDQMQAAFDAGECDKMVQLADESLALFEVWNQATYFKGKAAECQEKAKANAEYEKSKLSDADCEQLKADAVKFYEAENYEKALELVDKGYAVKCITSAGSDSEYRTIQIASKTFIQMEAGKYTRPKVEDQGMTSDAHKSNVGKIVFANTEIEKGSPNTGSFKNSFSTSDNIYSRVFLAQSLENEANEIGKIAQMTDFHYLITVNGHTYSKFINHDYNAGMAGDELETWTSFQLGLNPQTSDLKSYPSTEWRGMFWHHAYYLPEGEYDVKIALVFDIPDDEEATSARPKEQCRLWTTKFGAEKIVAEGSFKLKVNNSDKLTLSKKLCEPLPTAGKLHSSTMASTMKAQCSNKWDGQVPVKAICTSDDWNYHRNWKGEITHRTCQGTVVVKHTKENDMYQVLSVQFAQQNQGGEKYGATKMDGVAGGDFIAKELVK